MKLLVDLTSYNLKSLLTALKISVYISIWCVRGTFLLDCVRFAGPFLFKNCTETFCKNRKLIGLIGKLFPTNKT